MGMNYLVDASKSYFVMIFGVGMTWWYKSLFSSELKLRYISIIKPNILLNISTIQRCKTAKKLEFILSNFLLSQMEWTAMH